MNTPFVIGHTYWLPRLTPQQIQVPCPVCYGKKVVTVTLGNGEYVAVECEGCGLGFERARGYVTEYTYEPFVQPFTVRAVTSMHNESWWLSSVEGEHAEWIDLANTEEEALIASQQRLTMTLENQSRSNAARKPRDLKKFPWTVRYHEMCIADLAEKIAWHRAHVSARKAQP